MNYPLISEYVQSIKMSEDNLDKLSNLRPVLDSDGNPIMSSGNFAVVFKMEDNQTGKLYAVKCFLREQEGREGSYKLISSELESISSTFLIPIKYLEKEIFVDTNQSNETEFPVLQMDWVEGMTLDNYLRNNINDTYRLSLVVYQFCRMASWLLCQDFAHGDLKPDNIIVRDDGQLVLIDYDGMYVPSMRGQVARELGSIDYRHPMRSKELFNNNIDDFSIATIALSLKAISIKPELFNEFGASDRLLFSMKDYHNLEGSECLKSIIRLSGDKELLQLLGLFYIAYARNELSYVSYKLYNLEKPKIKDELQSCGLSMNSQSEYFIQEDLLFSKDFQQLQEVTNSDLITSNKDVFDVVYSNDYLKLIKGNNKLKTYEVHRNVHVICNCAFMKSEHLSKVSLPDSLKTIGKEAFWGCTSLGSISIPDSVKSIGEESFWGCYELSSVKFGRFLSDIGQRAFWGCRSLHSIQIPDSVNDIKFETFMRCSSLINVILPFSLVRIEDEAFRECYSLKKIVIPNSVESIGKDAFYKCISLETLILPNSIKYIGMGAFWQCHSLKKIVVPKGEITKFRKILDKAIVNSSVIIEENN